MNDNNSRTAFVTGSTGFVGLNLCEALLAEQWRVLALHRETSDTRYLRRLAVEPVVGDILDVDSLARGMPEHVDAVFHVAGDINMWSRRNARQTAINVEGTRNMVACALAKKARRFIFTSSISAFGVQAGPISETTSSVAGHSSINYERSKWQAEEIVRDADLKGLSSSIINPGGIMGPRDRSSWASMVFQLRDGRIKGIPPGAIPISHVKEVVKAHIAAVDRGRNRENYILAGTMISFEELFHLIAETIGVKLEARVAPVPMLKIIARLQTALAVFTGKTPDLTPEMVTLLCSRIDCIDDKAKRELGYRAVPVQTCVEDCVNWLRAENLL